MTADPTYRGFALDAETALALLQWQAEMGADEPCLDAPLNRYDLPERSEAAQAAAAAPAPAPTPEPAEEEPAAEAETSVAVESSESAPAANGKSQKGIITDVGEMVAYCRKVDG